MENAENELLRRFEELGWSYATLAAKVAEIRGTDPSEMTRTVNNIKSSIIKCLKNPESSSLRNVKVIAEAMGGEFLGFSWQHSKTNIKR